MRVRVLLFLCTVICFYSHGHSLYMRNTFCTVGLLHLHSWNKSMNTKQRPFCKPNSETESRDYKFFNLGSRDWEFNPGVAITNHDIHCQESMLTENSCPYVVQKSDIQLVRPNEICHLYLLLRYLQCMNFVLRVSWEWVRLLYRTRRYTLLALELRQTVTTKDLKSRGEEKRRKRQPLHNNCSLIFMRSR